MKVSLVEEMRSVDKVAAEEYALPSVVLMENAGHRAAEVVSTMLTGGDVAGSAIVVLAGSGNNGGDALAAARHLANAGGRIKVFLAGDKSHFSAATAAMYTALSRMGIEIAELNGDRDWDRLHIALRKADCLIDGILGTGFAGELRKKTLRLIEQVNEAARPVLAIDIPSGVAADTGIVSTVAVQARATLTLGLPKVGQLLSPGADYCGRLIVDDIGIPRPLLADEHIHQALIDDELAAAMLPPRPRSAHKGTCGRILVIAGSRGMTGAATLAASAALRAGAGIVTLAVPASLHDIMEVKLTEVMTQPVPEPEPGCGYIGGQAALDCLQAMAQSYDAVLIGPGLGRAAATQELVRIFASSCLKPLVLDADAIYAFRSAPQDLAQLAQVPILTPHLGELAGLLGCTVPELRRELLSRVRQAAAEYQCIFVAKSECTLVVYPDGDAFFSVKGNPGMATAGCGDVLAGTIAGLMQQMDGGRSSAASDSHDGLAPLMGVYLHGLAGDLAYAEKGEGLIASDVRDHLPAALQQVRQAQS